MKTSIAFALWALALATVCACSGVGGASGPPVLAAGPNSPSTQSLTTLGATAALSHMSLNFGSVVLGRTATLPVSLKNGGTSKLNIHSITAETSLQRETLATISRKHEG